MVEEPEILGKIDIFGEIGFPLAENTSNNLFRVNQILKIDKKRVWNSRRSLKGVMVMRPKILIFFRKIDIFEQNRLFYLIRLPENNFFRDKTDQRKRKSIRL